MSSLDLSKKVGPLPLGVWIAVIGGGLTIGYIVSNRKDKSVEPAPQILAETNTGTGGAQLIYDPPQIQPETPIEETNFSWGRKAATWLIAQGYDPGISENTIRKALNSLDLTIQEQALWNLVLTKFGVPPEPLAPVNIPVTPPPITTPPVTPPTSPPVIKFPPIVIKLPTSSKSRTNVFKKTSSPVATVPSKPTITTHTVAPGDTLSGISSRLLGSAGRWTQLYDRNTAVIENAAKAHGRGSSRGGPRNEVGWYIYPGTVLTLP